jgi:hypothetical protein
VRILTAHGTTLGRTQASPRFGILRPEATALIGLELDSHGEPPSPRYLQTAQVRRDGVPCSAASGRCRGIRSAFVKNPCQIPAVVEGVVSIRSKDIGEFHCAAF